MFGFFRWKREAAAAEAAARARREEVSEACAKAIYASEKLADRIAPERVALRRAGVVTTLPILDGAMADLVDRINDIRRRAGETPIEQGLLRLGVRRDRS